MSKLHIPGPEHETTEEIFGDVELGALICFFLAATLLYFFSQQAPTQVDTSTMTIAEREAAETVNKLSREARKQRKQAMSFDDQKAGVLERHAWTTDDILVVLRFGKRETAESACRARSAQFKANTVSDPLRLELLKVLDRRDERAPYTCLSHLFFNGDLQGYNDLNAELEEFWAEAEAYQGQPRLVGTVVDEFRRSRLRPESPRFYAWLRMCGLNVEYGAAPNCQLLLRTIAPTQGADLLETFQIQLKEAEGRPQDIPLMTKAMGHFARNGQPSAFKVAETKALPDYDVDFRQGALFMLCRFIFSPDEDVARGAAEELADTANYGARAFDKHLKNRWRHTCYNGFNKPEEPGAVKILAVWNGKPESKPVYSMQPEIDNGRCEVTEGYPIWHCGSKAWHGEGRPLDQALGDFFVDTRKIETDTWEY